MSLTNCCRKLDHYTALKIIFRIGDSDYAQKLSKLSGKRPVFSEQVNKSLGEKNTASTGWRETHVPVIDADLLTHLPMPSDRAGQASAGVLFGLGVAKIFYVGFIPVSGKMPTPKIAPIYQSKLTSAEELI